MARLPRIIVPGVPHHVTQRGNRRQRVFMEDDDYALYKDWLARSCRSNGVEVWSYCLMPNHVHLILVPSDDTGLSRAVGETHRRYSGYINARLRVTAHLFQGRFGCVAMDESHLMAAFRYVALNPVKAKLATTAVDWTWSSTPAHFRGNDDGLVTVQRVQPVARALLSHFFRKFIIRCIAWIQTLAFPFDSKTRKFVPCAAQFDATHTEHGMCAIQYPAHS